jgi:hypothetical protein
MPNASLVVNEKPVLSSISTMSFYDERNGNLRPPTFESTCPTVTYFFFGKNNSVEAW